MYRTLEVKLALLAISRYLLVEAVFKSPSIVEAVTAISTVPTFPRSTIFHFLFSLLNGAHTKVEVSAVARLPLSLPHTKKSLLLLNL